MHVEFKATECGFENGMAGASNSDDAGVSHYVLFGKDGESVYFEYDDQIHGDIDHVTKVLIHPYGVEFTLQDNVSITVRSQTDDLSWDEFLEAAREVFAPIIGSSE